MATFQIAYELTNAHEGGYANVSGDFGGETYKGIARNYWPTWEGWKIVDNYKQSGSLNLLDGDTELQDLVRRFYELNFWNKARLNEIGNQNIANEVYDSGVNFGMSRGIKFLQEAINLIRKDLSLTVDGAIGPKTLAAANTTESGILYKVMNLLQGEAYINNVRKNPTQKKFFLGWLTRVKF